MRNFFLLPLILLTMLVAHADETEVASSNEVNASPITNFRVVVPGKIYRGGRLVGPEDAAFLRSLSIRTVMDLQGGDLDSPFGIFVPYFEKGEMPVDIELERSWVEDGVLATGERKLIFYSRPLNSMSQVTPAEALRIHDILEVMNNPDHQPIYVHCAHGADRTGLIIALYRVIYQGWTLEAAKEEMKEDGHNELHELFTHAMDDYLVNYSHLHGLCGKIIGGTSPSPT